MCHLISKIHHTTDWRQNMIDFICDHFTSLSITNMWNDKLHTTVLASSMSRSAKPLMTMSGNIYQPLNEIVGSYGMNSSPPRTVVNGEANIPNVFVMLQSNTQHDISQGSLAEASLLQPEEWLNNSLPLPRPAIGPQHVRVSVCDFERYSIRGGVVMGKQIPQKKNLRIAHND